MIWSEKILKDKRIIVTGASSGIGRSCAVVCSSLGARIIAMGRNGERLKETMDMLAGTGHNSVACDITDSAELREKLAFLSLEGGVSGFIHSAGMERTNILKSIDADDFSDMFRINVIAGVEIARLLSAPKVYDKNGCGYVFISSVSGLYGEKGRIEYSSTKAALYGLVKSMARELAPKGIRVNCVSPGMVNTPMLQKIFSTLPEDSVASIGSRHLLGIPRPEDIANLCAYLISDLGKFMTGGNIVVDGGYSLI